MDVTKVPSNETLVTKVGRPPIGKHAMSAAERVRKHRQGITEPVVSEGVTLGVTGELTGPWLTVAEYINRPVTGMPNLERLQRISGSLGKYADQVWFGLGGLTMSDIGKVISTQPAMMPK